jgi:hypothetical protein
MNEKFRNHAGLQQLIKTFDLVANESETNQINNNLKNKNKMAKRAEKKSTLFLQIVNGKLGAFVNEPTQFSEAIKDKDDKVRNYEMFESITGKLKQVYVYDKELANDQVFEMLVIKVQNASGENEVISLPFKSNYAKSFIARLENIDLDKDVEIKCFKIEDKEKTKAKGKKIYNELLLPYQDGKSLDDPYKLNGKKKLPEAAKTTVKEKGKPVTKYDFTDQQEFLRELVKEANEVVKSKNAIVSTVSIGNESDDLSHDSNDLDQDQF